MLSLHNLKRVLFASLCYTSFSAVGCHVFNPSKEASKSQPKELPKEPSIIEFSAIPDPGFVGQENKVELAWKSENTDACRIFYNDQFIDALASVGSYVLTLDKTTNLNLVCSNSDGKVTDQSIEVTMLSDRTNPPSPTETGAPKINLFEVSRNSLRLLEGDTQNITVRWQAEDYDSCRLSLDSTVVVEKLDTSPYLLPVKAETLGQSNRIVKIECIHLVDGKTLETSQQKNLEIFTRASLAPVISEFKATPEEIELFPEETTNAVISWKTEKAKTCELKAYSVHLPDLLSTELSGSYQFSNFKVGALFELECKNDHGNVSKKLRVKVKRKYRKPVIQSFTVFPAKRINPNINAKFSWDVKYATSCRLTSNRVLFERLAFDDQLNVRIDELVSYYEAYKFKGKLNATLTCTAGSFETKADLTITSSRWSRECPGGSIPDDVGICPEQRSLTKESCLAQGGCLGSILYGW